MGSTWAKYKNTGKCYDSCAWLSVSRPYRGCIKPHFITKISSFTPPLLASCQASVSVPRVKSDYYLLDHSILLHMGGVVGIFLHYSSSHCSLSSLWVACADPPMACPLDLTLSASQALSLNQCLLLLTSPFLSLLLQEVVFMVLCWSVIIKTPLDLFPVLVMFPKSRPSHKKHSFLQYLTPFTVKHLSVLSHWQNDQPLINRSCD